MKRIVVDEVMKGLRLDAFIAGQEESLSRMAVKKLIEDALYEITEGAYSPRQDSNFFSKETGQIYDINKKVRETDLKNGSRIILI